MVLDKNRDKVIYSMQHYTNNYTPKKTVKGKIIKKTLQIKKK